MPPKFPWGTAILFLFVWVALGNLWGGVWVSLGEFGLSDPPEVTTFYCLPMFLKLKTHKGFVEFDMIITSSRHTQALYHAH